jgi:hypothetical protein
MMNYKTLVAAALMSTVLASSAFAQCADCSIYQDRDPFTQGLATPAGRPAGPNAAISPHATNNARAEMRSHYSHGAGRGNGFDSNRPRK